MVQKKSSIFDEYSLNTLTGGNILNEKPLMCQSGKFLIINNKDSVHKYNTDTGSHEKQLFKTPHSIVNVYEWGNNLGVLAYTQQGVCISYNFTTGELIESSIPFFQEKTQKVDEIKFHHYAQNKHFLYVSWSKGSSTKSSCHSFNLKNKYTFNGRICNKALQNAPKNFAVTNDIFVGIGLDYVWLLGLNSKLFRKHYIGHNIKVTCVEMHPDEKSFATGDSLGRIIVWRNAFEQHPLKEILHWHTLPVQCISFTECGAHLFSGGSENVLVKWSFLSQRKTFLPRLSSPIIHISTTRQSSLLAISTADSRILIINANLKCLQTIQHFSKWSTMGLKEFVPCILTRDPRSDCIVMNGRTGHLQFFSPNDGRFLYTLDVCNRNLVSQKNIANVENVEVRLAQFTRCGKWLVTAQSGCREARLIFWLFDSAQQQYKLNTDVDSPHGDTDIFGLDISSDQTVATTGSDNNFCLWEKSTSTNALQIKTYWTEATRHNYRELSISGALNFSQDSSLIGVAFQSTLTLWDTVTHKMKASLTSPFASKSVIKHVKFGTLDASHLIVTGTLSEITCWNLVTLSVQWIVPVRLSILVSSFENSFMAAFTLDNKLFIFHPSSPTPEYKTETESKSPIIAGHLSLLSSSLHLLFLNNNQELFSLEKASSISNEIAEETMLTPFATTLGQKSNVDIRKTAVPNTNFRVPGFSSIIYDAAPHAIPNLELICKSHLESLLGISSENDAPSTHVKNTSKTTDRGEKINVQNDDTTTLDEKELLLLVQKVFKKM